MISKTDVSADINERRVAHLTRGADLAPVAELLRERGREILERWLEIARQQPFHRRRPDLAVTDHLPHLLEGVVALLERTAPPTAQPAAPLDDARVNDAAREHSFMRIEQGLGPADIVTEFRLLRHEISRVLRLYLDDGESPADIVAAELIVNDALDGATAMTMKALSNRVEEVRADFLATTLHDARQPIGAARLSVEMAQRAMERPEPDLGKAGDALRRAVRALDRMNIMLGRLADASRLALGSLELRHEDTRLGVIVRRVVDDLDPEAAMRVRLVDHDDTGGLWDPGALEQVVANLVGNALKFSPPDSPIEIDITGDPTEVLMIVRDHGRGLQPEDFEPIFQRFIRSREAENEGVAGQGLGLYLCRGIVDAHGGRIWVESEGEGLGSAFRVQLPRRPPDDGADEGQD